MNCSICYSHSPLHILPCGHIYHENCINEWIRIKNSCPLCRQKISEGIKVSDVQLFWFLIFLFLLLHSPKF